MRFTTLQLTPVVANKTPLVFLFVKDTGPAFLLKENSKGVFFAKTGRNQRLKGVVGNYRSVLREPYPLSLKSPSQCPIILLRTKPCFNRKMEGTFKEGRVQCGFLNIF